MQRLVLRKGKERLAVAWSEVASLSPDQGHAVLGEGARPLPLDPAAVGEGEILALKRDVLDRQIIDTQGRKVVRVNDIALEEDGGRPVPAPRRHRPRRGRATPPGRPRRAPLRAPAGRGVSAPRHPLGLRGPRGPPLGHDPPEGPPAAGAPAPRRPRRHHRGPRPRRPARDRLDARPRDRGPGAVRDRAGGAGRGRRADRARPRGRPARGDGAGRGRRHPGRPDRGALRGRAGGDGPRTRPRTCASCSRSARTRPAA